MVRIPLVTPNLVQDIKQTPKEECEARGWIWNEALKSCDNPNAPKPIEPTVATPPAPIPEIEAQRERGGRPSEQEVPRGVPLTREQSERLSGAAEFERSLGGRPSAQEAILANQQAALSAQRKLSIASTIGNIDMETALAFEEQGINVKEALLSGISKIAPAAIGGAATFGAVGAVATAPAGGAGALVTAPIGAIGGAVGGFYVGVTSNIKAQKADLISGKITELSGRRRAMQGYITAANANPASADQMVAAYNTELSLIHKDYNTLNKEANEDLTLFGGQDGTSQLIAYEVFFESLEPSLSIKLEQAVLRPDPTRAFIFAEDL